MIDADDLSGFISKEIVEVRVYSIFSALVILIGLALILFGSKSKETADLINIGGGLVTTISGVPLSRVLYIRKRIFMLKIVKRKLESKLTEEDRKKLEESLWKNISSVIENGNAWFTFSSK